MEQRRQKMTNFERIINMTAEEFAIEFVDFMSKYEPYIAYNKMQSIMTAIRYLESEEGQNWK